MDHIQEVKYKHPTRTTHNAQPIEDLQLHMHYTLRDSITHLILIELTVIGYYDGAKMDCVSLVNLIRSFPNLPHLCMANKDWFGKLTLGELNYFSKLIGCIGCRRNLKCNLTYIIPPDKGMHYLGDINQSPPA